MKSTRFIDIKGVLVYLGYIETTRPIYSSLTGTAETIFTNPKLDKRVSIGADAKPNAAISDDAIVRHILVSGIDDSSPCYPFSADEFIILVANKPEAKISSDFVLNDEQKSLVNELKEQFEKCTKAGVSFYTTSLDGGIFAFNGKDKNITVCRCGLGDEPAEELKEPRKDSVLVMDDLTVLVDDDYFADDSQNQETDR